MTLAQVKAHGFVQGLMEEFKKVNSLDFIKDLPSHIKKKIEAKFELAS